MNHFLIDEGLIEVLSRINTLRHSSSKEDWMNCYSVAEEIVETLFKASNHLAIYGSLAPGKVNHHVIADIKGQWLEGNVRGRLHENGWGSGLGFPGIIWDPDGSKVKVYLFLSKHLPENWKRLDHFEGDGYKRILVPIHNEGGIIAVANIYEVRR